MKNILFIVFLFFVSSHLSLGEEIADPCRKSTEGTDFWFGFMESRWHSNNHKLEITVTARETTTFEIFYGTDSIPLANNPISVSANNQVTILIDDELVEAKGSEVSENKGIHLISKKPVNVYALNYDRRSSDVAVIYPTTSLGVEYFAMCYTPNVNGKTGKNSEFLIVATEDSTTVKITPSKVTDQKHPKDSTFTVTLNKGQVYQVQSENEKKEDGGSEEGEGDLTGSYIISDKPIAFYSGSYGTTIPATQNTSAWDHLYEQIPPVHSWGRKFYTVPLIPRHGDIYRILAAEDNTKVIISNSATPIELDRGQFHEVFLENYEPSYIHADKKILVAQYSRSMSADAGTVGDPFMIILSPTTQAVNDVTFVAYNSDVITEYYVNIVARTEETNQILLDGSSIQHHFKPYANSDYSYAQISLDPKTYHIWGESEKNGFLAYVYGFGDIESYGYGVGFNLDLTLDLGESIDFENDTSKLCYGEKLTLDAGPYFDTYEWNTGETTQTITVTEQKQYSVKTTTTEGCNLEDTVYLLVSKPIVDIGNDDDGCAPHQITLDASNKFEKYIWQNKDNDTLSTEQVYTANQTNEYRITVLNEYNCTARDTMNLVVFPVPKTKIEGETLICGDTTSQLSVLISDAPESIWNYDGSFIWSSNKPAALTFSEKTNTSAKIDVTKWGEYEIYYHLETKDGCSAGDTFLVRFHPQPTSDFRFEEDSKCEGYSKKLIYEGAATDSAFFYWDLDGCQFVDTLDWQTYNVTVGVRLITPPFIKLVIDDNGCWSDTTSEILGARPNFTMDADNLRGCDELTVNFTSELLTDDNVDFVWTFNDGESVERQNVKRYYPTTGFYKVSLTITNPVTQCQNGFTLDSMIKVFPTPTAAITADPLFCYPDSANIIYTNNIDSSFCNWSFEGAHKIGVGNDSITIILDDPFGKASLIVDEFGCLSDSSEITLKRKPHFDFYTDNEEGCQPYTLEIIADPKDEFLDFTWLTDSLPYPSGISNLYLLPDSGRFDITLISTSQETGCWDTLIKSNWIWVHPKPIAAFEVNYPSALIEHADIVYTNLTEYATDYFWDFDDNFTSIEKDPSHTYTQLGEFNSQLFANSDYGCKDTTEFVIKVLPFTVFTPNAFRPNSEIQENRTFMPVGVGADISRFSIKIFDRWGQMVFEADTPEHFWDGTTKNGTPAPMGNYVWTSHYFDIQGFVHNQKGQVLLMR